MTERFLFDTCFLIDLEREMKRGPGAAHRFLIDHQNSRACLTWTIAGEFAEGFGDISHPAWPPCWTGLKFWRQIGKPPATTP
jgi:hypothetical protein